MEYFFINMAAAAGLTVIHAIRTIFMHFCECIGSYLGYGIVNAGLQMLSCQWFAGITLLFNDAPQKIVQRCEIAASRRLIDITISGT